MLSQAMLSSVSLNRSPSEKEKLGSELGTPDVWAGVDILAVDPFFTFSV